MPLYRRMPYDPYSLVSNLRRPCTSPLPRSGRLCNAPTGKAGEARTGGFASFTQALGRLLPGIVKSSGTMDPDGKPQLATPPAITASDSSGTMDPDGRK